MLTAWEIFKWTWWLMIVLWMIGAKLLWRKYPIEAIIVEKRGDNLVKTNDRLGKYFDKYTGINGSKLKKAKDTIPVLNYEWILHNIQVSNTILERLVNLLRGCQGTVFLFKYGSKQYKPIQMIDKTTGKSVTKFQQVIGDDGQPVYVKVWQQFDPRDKLGALDFVVVDWDNINFMVQEQRTSMTRRQKQKEFWKQVIIPIAMLAITGLVCIIMIKFAADWTPAGQTQPTSEPAKAPNIPVISNVLPGG